MKYNRICLAIIWVLFLLTSCKKEGNTAGTGGMVQPPPGTSRAKTYLALGDSYTIGQGVGTSERFPVQTKNILQGMGLVMAEPIFIARTGWTTTDLQNAIASEQLSGTFDLVSLLIGVNDQFQRHDTTGYRQRFTDLLQTSIRLAANNREHVFVLSIPDYSVTPFARNSDTTNIRIQIDQFNVINKEVTLNNGCHYLDITPSTRMAKTDNSLIAGDGLHPSGKEYRKWAEWLAAMVKLVI